jgi:hypothetical protein
MTKDEALRLALEALIEIRDANIRGLTLTQDYYETITAIKAALEAKDEPVAWAMLHDNGHFIDAIHPNEHARVEGEYITPLYTTPPQRKPLTGKMLLRAAQASLSPEQYDHFEAMSKHQPDIYDRLAYSIGVQDE